LHQVWTRFGPGLDSVPNKSGATEYSHKEDGLDPRSLSRKLLFAAVSYSTCAKTDGWCSGFYFRRQRMTCIGVCEQASAKCVAMDNHVLDAADCLKPQSNQREGGRRQKGGNLLYGPEAHQSSNETEACPHALAPGLLPPPWTSAPGCPPLLVKTSPLPVKAKAGRSVMLGIKLKAPTSRVPADFVTLPPGVVLK